MDLGAAFKKTVQYTARVEYNRSLLSCGDSKDSKYLDLTKKQQIPVPQIFYYTFSLIFPFCPIRHHFSPSLQSKLHQGFSYRASVLTWPQSTFGSTAETKLSRLWDEWAFGTLTLLFLLHVPPHCTPFYSIYYIYIYISLYCSLS